MDESLKKYAYMVGAVVVGATAVLTAIELKNGDTTEDVLASCPVKVDPINQKDGEPKYQHVVVKAQKVVQNKVSHLVLPEPEVRNGTPAWVYTSPEGCVIEDPKNPFKTNDLGFDTAPEPCACSTGENCEVLQSETQKWVPAPISETLGHGYHYENFKGAGCISKACTGSYSPKEGDDTWPKECPE